MADSFKEETMSPEARDTLLRELKKRLEEVEALRRVLGVKVEEEKEEEKANQNPILKVQEALEEINVPPLELLEDRPMDKKKKGVNSA